LDTLEATHGTTKGQKGIYVVCEDNRVLAESFKELVSEKKKALVSEKRFFSQLKKEKKKYDTPTIIIITYTLSQTNDLHFFFF
jgi:hypothetical protein